MLQLGSIRLGTLSAWLGSAWEISARTHHYYLALHSLISPISNSEFKNFTTLWTNQMKKLACFFQVWLLNQIEKKNKMVCFGFEKNKISIFWQNWLNSDEDFVYQIILGMVKRFIFLKFGFSETMSWILHVSLQLKYHKVLERYGMNYRTRAIIVTRSWFETALNKKLRILDSKNEELPLFST